MRLLFFNRSFYPDVEATGQLLTELCDDLSQQHEVTVVAGRAYNMRKFGSWWPVKRERRGSVLILRAYNPRLNKRNFAGRILNLLSYFCFSFLAGFSAPRSDVVIAETDPPVLGLVGLFFAKLHRAKFIFYVQDLFPDVGVALGRIRSPILIWLLKATTRELLTRADLVVVLGEDMCERIARKGYIPRDKIRVIPNWADTSRLSPQPTHNGFREQHGLDHHHVVMFSGNLGLAQGLDGVIETAAALADQKNLRFIFVGEGAAKAGLMARARELRLKNVLFVPPQPKESLSESLSAADVHLVTLRQGLAGLLVPSKVYGIMAAGRPFIAAVDRESEIAGIIGRFRCGILIEPGSLDQLRLSICLSQYHQEAFEQMGRNGRLAAENYFDRKICVGKFAEAVAELAEAREELPKRLRLSWRSFKAQRPQILRDQPSREAVCSTAAPSTPQARGV